MRARGRETLKTGPRRGMKHHVLIDAPGRARPVASTANMYTLASVRLLSFWLTAIYIMDNVARQSRLTPTRTVRASNALECIRLYIVVVEATGRARPGVYVYNVYGHVMFHPRPRRPSMFPSPAQLNAPNKSRTWDL